ncbi:uncharacterized protein BO72DRAFT_476976 [Aspergillus fijiensis CBS 313.89]|uniref:PBP domain-containing protein n=1 Tax=Aspergillus fijiensis CBS 313.89 TaxID=1448319 RepID=A0A8G1RSR6_9EURO|nr:uncharacterized protein BO72DRAFT_476976 [Aspergillus fijiensis CBS 313.89]RAK78012.1 hypothetical protein BO72DRAFT_476976 [Aspergillus fijiensis CBS 313.89]
MIYHNTLLGALATLAIAVEPTALYNGGCNSAIDVKLRIWNGGGGQSGFIEALADDFIKASMETGSAPFKVAWYKSDTTSLAIRQSVAKGPAWYAWRDHFLLVDPHSNPVRLNKTDDILTMFSSLYTAAKNGGAPVGTMFLSRYDKSATNIKESDLWIGIEQVPWTTTYSTWYRQYIAYFGAANAKMADRFAQWVTSSEGQAIITGLKKNGQQLYTGVLANKTAHFEDLCR